MRDINNNKKLPEIKNKVSEIKSSTNTSIKRVLINIGIETI